MDNKSLNVNGRKISFLSSRRRTSTTMIFLLVLVVFFLAIHLLLLLRLLLLQATPTPTPQLQPHIGTSSSSSTNTLLRLLDHHYDRPINSKFALVIPFTFPSSYNPPSPPPFTILENILSSKFSVCSGRYSSASESGDYDEGTIFDDSSSGGGGGGGGESFSSDEATAAAPIHLILYSNNPLPLEYIRKLTLLFNSHPKRLASCFDKLIFASYTPFNDEYPLGPSEMFFNLFHQDSLLVSDNYHSFFYMEQDTRPCRDDWMDALVEAYSSQSEYWIMGSLIRDAKSPDLGLASYATHINGNAFYRIGDEKFRDFIGIVEQVFWLRQRLETENQEFQEEKQELKERDERPDSSPYLSSSISSSSSSSSSSGGGFGGEKEATSSAPPPLDNNHHDRIPPSASDIASQAYFSSYDIAIHMILHDTDIFPFHEFARMAHRFVYTNVVQNWYRARDVTLDQICGDGGQGDDSTVLIHGRYIEWTSRQN